MTIVQLIAIHPKPGASWADLQKHLKKGADATRKHGGENVTMMAGMAAGAETGTLSMLVTNADWTSFGKYFDALMADPEAQALMTDPNSPVARWDTYLLQTIPDM
jgi:hypothetical protein